jgi:molybdopterin-synthase adenylyltransferase
MMFSYDEFTKRNIGFVTADQQARLKAAHVFVCGCGGMGGATILALARTGVGRLTICDIDDFEVSNLNRQVFAWTDTVGRHKAEATAEQLAARQSRDLSRGSERTTGPSMCRGSWRLLRSW